MKRLVTLVTVSLVVLAAIITQRQRVKELSHRVLRRVLMDPAEDGDPL
jgi:hypothetical protein